MASPGSKAAEPSSLPSGFAAQGLDTSEEGKEGKTHSIELLPGCATLHHIGEGHEPLCGIFPYSEAPVSALHNAMHFSTLQHPKHINWPHYPN